MLIHWYRFANWFFRHHIPVLPKIIYYVQYLLFNSSVPASCVLGGGTKFAYGGIAVVIHARAVVGKNCVIGQCVTIGGRSKHYEVPKIGDNVYIGAGAKILGPITVGNNSVIGAGAVVTKTLPPYCLVAGVPAKPIKRKWSIDEILEHERALYPEDQRFSRDELESIFKDNNM